jgi:hypothetical protein
LINITFAEHRDAKFTQSAVRLDPSARSDPPSLTAGQPSPTGATSFSIRPSPRRFADWLVENSEMFSLDGDRLRKPARISRMEYPSYAMFLLRGLDTQRVYRLFHFT